VASNYVSIVWEGFMQVPASGLYTFTVNANDGFRLTLNQVLILD